MTEEQVESGTNPDASVQSKPAVHFRTKVLVGLLALMSVTFGVNTAHVYALENELREIAREKEALELERADQLGIPVETAFIVTASKEFLIYGDVQGKIEVFVRKQGSEQRIIGTDYFLARDSGDWTVFESGKCTDETCQIRGTKALAEK